MSCFLRLIALLCMLGTPALAEPTLRDINEMSGFDEVVAGFSEAFIGATNNPELVERPELREALALASEGAFDTDRMISAIEDLVAPKISREHLTALHAFYDSPLGRKISAVEVAAARDTQPEQTQQQGKEILSTLAERDPARLALYRDICDALDAIDLAESLVLNISYAMLAGAVGAARATVTDEELATALQAQLGSIRELAEATVFESMAWTYRDISPAELRDYLAFLKTPAAERFYDATMTAFETVATAEARMFGHRLFVAPGLRKA